MNNKFIKYVINNPRQIKKIGLIISVLLILFFLPVFILFTNIYSGLIMLFVFIVSCVIVNSSSQLPLKLRDILVFDKKGVIDCFLLSEIIIKVSPKHIFNISEKNSKLYYSNYTILNSESTIISALLKDPEGIIEGLKRNYTKYYFPDNGIIDNFDKYFEETYLLNLNKKECEAIIKLYPNIIKYNIMKYKVPNLK